LGLLPDGRSVEQLGLLGFRAKDVGGAAAAAGWVPQKKKGKESECAHHALDFTRSIPSVSHVAFQGSRSTRSIYKP